jgi:excisionase family DNA binding protein
MDMAGKDSPTLSLARAAKLLKVGETQVCNYIRWGRLPAERVGRAYILKRADVLAFEKPERGRPRTVGK